MLGGLVIRHNHHYWRLCSPGKERKIEGASRGGEPGDTFTPRTRARCLRTRSNGAQCSRSASNSRTKGRIMPDVILTAGLVLGGSSMTCHESRVPHISLVFREMWDTAKVNFQPLQPESPPLPVKSSAIWHPGFVAGTELSREICSAPTQTNHGHRRRIAGAARGLKSCCSTPERRPRPFQSWTRSPARCLLYRYPACGCRCRP